ncbi:MAG TPA: TIGR03668 family PPOX class F420-dependent oxidoreductase [Methylomirabilota bacterium]|nr:TIGR03668 family PPOX class F420-dependent oxidoreductase [Methylomirabilota bacterium]
MHRQNKGDAASWAEELIRETRVGHLATCDTSLNPHVVPICYVFHDGVVYSAIDEKPKRKQPAGLRRVLNIKANPNVCLVIDHYEEDWRKLNFVIVHGKAKLIMSGREHRQAITRLRSKYPQYRVMKLQTRPIIRIVPTRRVAWRSDKRG